MQTTQFFVRSHSQELAEGSWPEVDPSDFNAMHITSKN